MSENSFLCVVNLLCILSVRDLCLLLFYLFIYLFMALILQ